MIMQTIRRRLNQKGFTLVELMVVIAILGVLAAIAIPKFNESTAAANTAKIQADLRTIDSAIIMATAEGLAYGKTGETANTDYTMTELEKYFQKAPTPPVGNAYAKDTKLTVTSSDKYEVSGGRAILQGYAVEAFGKNGTGTKL